MSEYTSYSLIVSPLQIEKAFLQLNQPLRKYRMYDSQSARPYFLTAWQYWLGIAKPKNVFRSTLNFCIKLLWNFKNFLFNKFSTDWLTIWLMHADKHNSITAKAIGLISSLLNVTSSWDVPFRQPLQLQCLYHGSTKAYLCSFFSFFLLSPLPHRWRFVVAPLHGFMGDLVIAEVFNTLSFCLNHSVNF